MTPIVSTSVSALQETVAAIRAMRAPLLLAIIAFFVLSRPAQVLELYLILARNPHQLWVQVALAILSLALLAFFLTFAGRSLARAADEVRVTAGEKSPQATVFRFLPIAIGILPLVGAAIGLHRALRSTLTDTVLSAVSTINALRSEQQTSKAIAWLKATYPDQAASFDALNFKQINDRLDLTVTPSIRALPDNADTLALAGYSGIAICGLLIVVLAVVFAAHTAVGILRACQSRVSPRRNLHRWRRLDGAVGPDHRAVLQCRPGHRL